jgi:NAD(P)-dependent dehydrogenase (short-subunit alcohol dehydrogenase family)
MGALDGKVALVTGGSSGIGYAIAVRYAEEGATVYLTGRRRVELEAAAASIGDQAIGIQGDISDLADLDRLFAVIGERSGRLDIVVANPAFGEFARLGEITEAGYRKAFDVNVMGTIFTVQKALPLLRRGASVIVLSSINGSKAIPAMSVYSATKAAGRSLVRSWAGELAEQGIRVNALSPGPTSTPVADEFRASGTEGDQHEQEVLNAIPLGRIGQAAEVAAAALFLGSDQSSYTTGAELFVDGGSAQV